MPPLESHRSNIVTLQSELARIVTHRLPVTMKLSKRLGHGESLQPEDLQMLQRVLQEAQRAAMLAADAPTYREMAVKMIHLHMDILRRAGTSDRELHVRISPATQQRKC